MFHLQTWRDIVSALTARSAKLWDYVRVWGFPGYDRSPMCTVLIQFHDFVVFHRSFVSLLFISRRRSRPMTGSPGHVAFDNRYLLCEINRFQWHSYVNIHNVISDLTHDRVRVHSRLQISETISSTLNVVNECLLGIGIFVRELCLLLSIFVELKKYEIYSHVTRYILRMRNSESR